MIQQRRRTDYYRKINLENKIESLPSKLEQARDILMLMNTYNSVIRCHLSKEVYREMHDIYRVMRKDIIERNNLEKGEFTKWYSFVRNRNNYLESFINS